MTLSQETRHLSEGINQLMKKRPQERDDVRITTYIEPELYDEVITLKRAGISIKKLVNVAITDLLKKHNIL